MGNEPALAFLKRKSKAAFNQRTIICYWTSGRHIPRCYSTAVADVIGRKSDVLLGLLKSEHKRKGCGENISITYTLRFKLHLITD